jgi:hypothetical protein
MPTDLSRLIAAYADRRQYTWNADGFDGLPAETRPMATATTDGQATELTVCRVPMVVDAWKSFVAEQSIADGANEWSVAWTLMDDGGYKSGWLGVGVTLSTANRQNTLNTGYSGIADRTDWILADASTGSHAELSLFHDGREKIRLPVSVRKIWFRVDAANGCVVARWLRFGSNSHGLPAVEPYVRTVSTSAFEQLRPVVVLSGTATAVVRSAKDIDAPADSDCQQLKIVGLDTDFIIPDNQS